MSKHLIILVDDVGIEGFRSYAKPAGVQRYPYTPNWDYLESIGVRFTRAYVSPICSPTRACLFTSRYGFRTGVGTNVFSGKPGPPAASEPWLPTALPFPSGTFGKWHLGNPSNGGPASPMKPTDTPAGVAGFDEHKGIQENILAGSGFSYWYYPYYVDGTLTALKGAANVFNVTSGTGIGGTATFTRSSGSWISDGYTTSSQIGAVGFGSEAQGNGNWPVSAVTALTLTVTDTDDLITTPASGGVVVNRTPADYNPTVIVDDALSWIASQAGDWCCVVQFTTAHKPRHAPNTAAEREVVGEEPSISGRIETAVKAITDGDTDLLDEIGFGNTTAEVTTYIAMIEAMDYEIGRLIAATNLSDTTIYAMTDNGPNEESVEAPLDPEKAKFTVYSLGTKAPLVIAGEAVPLSSNGKTCERMAHIVDLYRTITEAEGVDLGTTFPGVTFDGVDLQPLLDDPEAVGEREFSYTEFFDPNCVGGILDGTAGTTNDPEVPLILEWDRAVRDENYTLCQFMPNGPTGDITYELYATKGGDTQNDNQILIDQGLSHASVQALTAHHIGLDRLLAELDALLP